MRLTRRQLKALIVESLLLESKYDQLMMRLPDLSLSVSFDQSSDGALDLHDGDNLIASAALHRLALPDYPCIPETMSVSNIHVDTSYQNLGIGELLFDLVFYYASTLNNGKNDRKGFGITTDFEGGNTPIINYMIQSALQDPVYYKQYTKLGNDKMDFFNKTIDPDDDCYAELFDEDGVYEFIDDGMTEEEAYEEAGYSDENFPLGTTSSWRKRGIESMKPVWDTLTQRQSPDLLYRPVARMKGFRQAFDNTPTPEEIQDYQRNKKK